MKVRLNGQKNVYEEIAEQYKSYIRLGVLSDGEKLPSCRELAIELGINPNTVERAFSLLERDGFVVTIPKKGAYVSFKADKKTALLLETEKQLKALKGLGLCRTELNEIADRVYKERVKND